jgi:hypothetical protein
MKKYDNFHDGFLDGVLVEEHTVQIFLRTDRHQRFMATAQHVTALCLNDFWEGNIIFDIEVFDFNEISIEDLAEAPRGSQTAEQRLLEGRKLELLLIRINPSYGANLVMIASSFEVAARSGNLL